MLRRWFGVFVVLCAALCGVVHAQTWKPNKHVELVIPFAAASGNDAVARLLQNIWTTHKLVGASNSVVNKPGAGGSLGLNYTAQHAADPHYLVFASSTMLTNHIVGIGKLNYTDFTPVAMMLAEYLIFSVRADSALKTGADLVARLKKDPASVSISVGSAAGNVNHIAIAMVAKAAGADPKRLKVVVFGSAGEGMTALLGGHVDVAVSSLGVIVPQLEAGKLRALALSAPRRMPDALAAIPTWGEQGINVQLSLWRGIFAPKGVSADAVAYWEDVLARTAGSAEWQAQAKKSLWDATFKGVKEMRTQLDADQAALQSVLGDLGMAKAQ